MVLSDIQWAVVFAASLWWTSRWLLNRPVARWRYVVTTIIGALLWIVLSYTATNVSAVSGGQTTALGSEALLWVGVLMVIVHFVGLVLGLTLWAEEEAAEAGDLMPDTSET